MRRILFISPHLDDAVLSCGAHILQLVQSGFKVLIATVFTRSGNNTKDVELYLKRKNDDFAAAQLLDAQVLHLDFTDAPFRSKQYQDFSSILFHHHLQKSEKPFIELLARRLQELLIEFPAEQVWFPLGVGGHVDHHLVFESSKLLWNSPIQFNYYEDLPYALLDGWHAVRWQQLKATPSQITPTPEIKKISLVDTPYPFVHNYLASKKDISTSSKLFEKEWNDLQPGMDTATAWSLNGSHFYKKFAITTEQHLIKKCEAISCYTTEWPILFGPKKENILQFLRRHNASKEIYWSKDKL